MTLELTDDQYQELMRYEDGRALSRIVPPSRHLVRHSLLRMAPTVGRGFYRITPEGHAALRAYREIHL